jgi:hypothetical protein
VQITKDPTGVWYMPRALQNEVELHAQTCGAVTTKRLGHVSTETSQRSSTFEAAFAQIYAAQIAGEITSISQFCRHLRDNLRHEEAELAVGTLFNHELEPNYSSSNVIFEGSILECPSGVLKPMTLVVPRGTLISGRVESFGHGITGSYIWVGRVTSKQPTTLGSLHVWPVAILDEQVHAVHSGNERTFANELFRLGIPFAKPPTEAFLAEWIHGDQSLGCLLGISHLWPDFVLRIGKRVCVVELGGIRNWRYLVRLLEKEDEYRRNEKTSPSFEWAVIWPDAASGEYKLECGSPGNLLESYFPPNECPSYTPGLINFERLAQDLAVTGADKVQPSLCTGALS